MDIRVWRVEIDGHSAVFDDLDVAVQFIRAFLRERERPLPGQAHPPLSVQSEWMSEKTYREIVEAEDEGERAAKEAGQ
jgi:hypothetical protein